MSARAAATNVSWSIPSADPLAPADQRLAEPPQVLLDVVEDAEVGQRERAPARAARSPRSSAPTPRGRSPAAASAGARTARARCGRPAESPAYSVPSSCSIETWWLAWPGAREALEAEDVVADDPRRSPPAPGRARPRGWSKLRRRAGARSPRAARRVDEVRRADLRDVNLQRRVLAHERARGAGMVEVDVREEQVPDVAELEASLAPAPPSEPGCTASARSRRAPSPSSVSTT